MTRGSTKELFKPFKNLEQEFRSSRKLFKTPSLDESSSSEFDLFSDLEEHSEEEVVGTMTKTMEEYTCKTQSDYGSGVARPKIDAKDHFDLKGQFLKELRDDTFSDSDHEDANEHIEKTSKTRSTETSDGLTAIQAQLNNFRREIKKVNEKVYAAQVGCELCKGPHYTKDCPLKEEGKTLEEAYYTQFGVPFQQGGQYRAAAPRFYQRNNANPSYQERRQSIKVLQERGSKSLPSSTEMNPRDHVNSISTADETNTTPICRIGYT
ncbi:hypothetical protein Tco_1125057 [Tanacetum coccineum]|uniref:Eukaryotic translation initiation factor 3 subunit G N-terminal domain-containing protein n=1 Tax=Tanacetum coccineum TaxID=301880 RepID=A0ABQ5JAR4_9ASTR